MASRPQFDDRYVQGLRELMQAMRSLPIIMQQRSVKAGVAAAARVVRDAAKRYAPEDTGNLKRSIYFGLDRDSKRTPIVRYHVRVRGRRRERTSKTTGKTSVKHGAYYWWWVELGRTNRDGSFWPGKKFLRPALFGHGTEGVQKMRQTMARRLKRDVDKARQDAGGKP